MTLLEVKQIDKVFGGHYALQNVSLKIDKGEIHSIVGENGAGKSTLIKIITGLYAPTNGKILWNGQEVTIKKPKVARDMGINVIHQERSLIPYFTAFENLYLGSKYPNKKFNLGIDWKKLNQESIELMDTWGIDIPLKKLVQDLTPPQKTMLEILRAMMLECKLLILDEPTASLTDKESEILFSLIQRLKSEGTSIIYVSHRLEEIIRLSDRITVLRGGSFAGTLMRKEATHDRLIHLMTAGQKINIQSKRDQNLSEEPKLLEVINLSTTDKIVKNINLHVRRKEIVGIFGLAGSGRTEMLETIYGDRSYCDGQIFINNDKVKNSSPKNSLQKGMVLIPEDRRSHGLIMNMSIKENMTLPVIDTYSNGGVINKKSEVSNVEEKMNALKVKANNSEQEIEQLSGGNQQKVVFAKAMMSNPSVFLCDEPTQAVDIMTRNEIHRLLRAQADKGNSILFVSSDLQEVLELSDRVVVVSEGKTIADLANDNLQLDTVLQMCYRHRKEFVKN